ncbi:MAG: hypothetical protein HUJ22_11095 [Gracilimonas sp.]|uniref:hypothetical protein n=1 Tax=Gracilimonas sp. TaxID=1974203 RepID=UPI00198A4A9A|nr:hypothetical protein [Gracilimonas sp.]MBD3617105.1 hypothetical protein [Gracilimonas sp.]
MSTKHTFLMILILTGNLVLCLFPFQNTLFAYEVSDTLYIALPTGELETDRASILTALEQAEPGVTVQFATGTYLVGEVIQIATPGLTLLGHQEGTVLKGCKLEEYKAAEQEIIEAEGGFVREAISRCGMFELTGGGVTVHGLTFEQTRGGLMLGCCHMEPRFQITPVTILSR